MTDTIEQSGAVALARVEDVASLVARLRAHAAEIRERGVISLDIFGSRARGEERADSDLDVLVAYDPVRPFTLYDLVRVERLLERVTGHHVHVATRDGFSPHQLDRVLRDAVSVL
jgi:predicted nucleotidyltransferase